MSSRGDIANHLNCHRGTCSLFPHVPDTVLDTGNAQFALSWEKKTTMRFGHRRFQRCWDDVARGADPVPLMHPIIMVPSTSWQAYRCETYRTSGEANRAAAFPKLGLPQPTGAVAICNSEEISLIHAPRHICMTPAQYPFRSR